jgi:hypothetical protein
MTLTFSFYICYQTRGYTYSLSSLLVVMGQRACSGTGSYTHSLQCSFLCGSWFNHSNFMPFFHYYITCFGLTRTIVRCVCCCACKFLHCLHTDHALCTKLIIFVAFKISKLYFNFKVNQLKIKMSCVCRHTHRRNHTYRDVYRHT